MTLSYVGLVEPARFKDLVAVGDSIQLPAFAYTIDVAASFGKAAVAWLAADRTPAPLIELQQTLDNKLLEASFPQDQRPFRPHLSITRNITRAVDPWKMQETPWVIDRFCLVAAHAADERVRYETLREWRLG
jgi:2'-5' RNA ligase